MMARSILGHRQRDLISVTFPALCSDRLIITMIIIVIIIIIIIMIIIIQKIIGYPSQLPEYLGSSCRWKYFPSSMDCRTSLQVSGLTHDFKWGGCGVFPLSKSLLFGKSEDGLRFPSTQKNSFLDHSNELQYTFQALAN